MIDPDSPWPAWRQLADLLRDQILSGELAPGARLASEETMTQQYGIARNTVRQAISALRAEGLVDVNPPQPTRVRIRPDEETVDVSAGTIRTRMPTPQERRQLGIGEGVPVFIVDHDGESIMYAGDRTALRIAPPE
jgi:DNA-binding FadR family transcriptional regulator